MEAAGNTIFSAIYETQKRKEGLQSVFLFFVFFGRANEQSVSEDWSQLSALRRWRCFLVRFPSGTTNSEVGCVRRQPCPLYFLSFHSCSVGVAYRGCTEVWLGMSLLWLLSFLMRGAGAWCWCLGFHPKSKPCNSISVASNCRSCIESDFTHLSARTWVFNSSGIMFIHTAPARSQKTIIQCLVPSSTPCLMNRVQLLAFLGAETKDMV